MHALEHLHAHGQMLLVFKLRVALLKPAEVKGLQCRTWSWSASEMLPLCAPARRMARILKAVLSVGAFRCKSAFTVLLVDSTGPTLRSYHVCSYTCRHSASKSACPPSFEAHGLAASVCGAHLVRT